MSSDAQLIDHYYDQLFWMYEDSTEPLTTDDDSDYHHNTADDDTLF